MKNLKIGCILAMIFVVLCFSSCDDSLKGGASGSISDRDNTLALQWAFSSSLSSVYQSLPCASTGDMTGRTGRSNFYGETVSGSEGYITVTSGDKSTYWWPSRPESESSCDIYLSFHNFSNSGDLKIISGTGRYFYTSSSAKASYYEYIDLSGCAFEFNGFSGTVTGEYRHYDTGIRWELTFTYDNGETVYYDWLD